MLDPPCRVNMSFKHQSPSPQAVCYKKKIIRDYFLRLEKVSFRATEDLIKKLPLMSKLTSMCKIDGVSLELIQLLTISLIAN